MMQKHLLAKYRPHPSCRNGMEPVTTHVTPKTRDDLIYTIEDGEYELYKVVEVLEDRNYKCLKFNTLPKSFIRHPDLDFGKVFQNHSLLVTIARNILAEKWHLQSAWNDIWKYIPRQPVKSIKNSYILTLIYSCKWHWKSPRLGILLII